MSTFRQIPVHMLFLAGLVGPLAAQEKAPASARSVAVDSAAPKVAYAGLHVGPVSEQDRLAASTLPEGVGIRVGFVDPKGPSADKFEEGDIITRLEDQVVVNREQFRALVRMRKPGDVVRLTVVRGAEIKVVDLRLGETQALRAELPSAGEAGQVRGQPKARPFDPDPNGTVTHIGPGSIVVIGPNHGLPPEVVRRLEEMRGRGMMLPHEVTSALESEETPSSKSAGKAEPSRVQRSTSHSFSFGTGGASRISNSIAVDADGSVSLDEKDGRRQVVIKDASGKVIFEGEVTTEEQRAKMPEEARRRLRLVEGSSFSIPGFDSKPPAGPDAREAPAKPRKKFNPLEGA